MLVASVFASSLTHNYISESFLETIESNLGFTLPAMITDKNKICYQKTYTEASVESASIKVLRLYKDHPNLSNHHLEKATSTGVAIIIFQKR